MRIVFLLLADLRQQNSNLVGDVADGVIRGGLAPVGDLGRDADALFRGGFVGLDEVVLGLDQLVELLAELGLDGAAEGAQTEAMAGAGAGTVLIRADGESAIPVAVAD